LARELRACIPDLPQLPPHESISRSFSCGLEGDPDLRQGHEVRIIVRLRATEIGSYQDTLEIRFSRVSNEQLFSVTRTVKAIVGDAAGYALLQPTAPYVPRRRSNREEIGSVVEGIPPPRLLAIAWRTRLGRFDIPKTFRPIFSLRPNRPETDEEDIVPSQIRSLFGKPPRLTNHGQKFSILLWIEEVSMEYVDNLTQ
jgi:helicase MOV-10